MKKIIAKKKKAKKNVKMKKTAKAAKKTLPKGLKKYVRCYERDRAYKNFRARRIKVAKVGEAGLKFL